MLDSGVRWVVQGVGFAHQFTSKTGHNRRARGDLNPPRRISWAHRIMLSLGSGRAGFTLLLHKRTEEFFLSQ